MGAGGIGSGGRTTFAGGGGAIGVDDKGVVVALTRLARESGALGSIILGSANLGSASRGSDDDASASAGRGRGNGLAGMAAGVTKDENIGAGCGPFCRNNALAITALQAAKASRAATVSFGECSRIRIARPRSSSIAAAAPPRRRRGISSSSLLFLGTLLHLNCLFRHRRPQSRVQCRDLARWWRGRRI